MTAILQRFILWMLLSLGVAQPFGLASAQEASEACARLYLAGEDHMYVLPDSIEKEQKKGRVFPLAKALTDPKCKVDSSKAHLPYLQYVFDRWQYDHLKYVYDFLIETRKDPKLWRQAINARNTDGETLLDFAENKERKLVDQGSLNLRDKVREIVSYVCAHGGTYSKLASTKSCSSEDRLAAEMNASAELAIIAQIRQKENEEEPKRWESAKQGNKADNYEYFLYRYPNGRFAEQALAQPVLKKARREALEQEQKVKEEYAKSMIEAGIRLEESEENNRWTFAKTAEDSAYLQAFINEYPKGRYVAEARTKLAIAKRKEASGERSRTFRRAAKQIDDSMVRVPSGSFTMGGNFQSDAPHHTVHLKSFLLAKTEVTRGQWFAVMGFDTSDDRSQ